MAHTELNPTADAFVTNNGSSDNENYGSDAYLAIGRYSDGTAAEAFLKFDLSAAKVPAGARIDSAKLRLFQYDSANDWLSPTITARCVIAGASWSESGIVWTNKPGSLSGSPYDDTSFNDKTGSYVEWDVKALVQNIVWGTNPNNGFRVYSTTGGDSNAKYFRSSEYGTAGNRPLLIIDYTPSPVKINVGGTWKNSGGVWINVGGVWRQVTEMKLNVGGVWKTLG